MTQKREFYIEYSVKGASGVVTVIGCGGSVAIPVGASFTLIYRNKKRDYPRGLEQPAEREASHSLKITVRGITAYGKELSVLPPNSTGCLLFDECETDLLPGGWILSDE